MEGENFHWFGRWFRAIVDNVGLIVKGKRAEVGMVVLALLGEGHVLIDDFPGTGKTTLAKTLAASIEGSWNRVQFTPDLLPSDVTGGMIFNQRDTAFEFHAGPIFANVVLGDEINRASPKTQSALLQVMEESQVTVDGITHNVPHPFIVLATQNPVEQSGTYPLPEAQLDRFMIKLRLGYPNHDAEVAMLESVGSGQRPSDVSPIIEASEVAQMIAAVHTIKLQSSMQSYIVRLCDYTRDPERMPELRLGVSPRGAVALMQMARAKAAADSRNYVNVDDVVAVAPFVMGHRMLLTPQAELDDVTTSSLVQRTLRDVKHPDLKRV